jgi:hypothetical protein
VTISSIGLLTALKALLESEPDDISPLSGADLVALKVFVVRGAMHLFSPHFFTSCFFLFSSSLPASSRRFLVTTTHQLLNTTHSSPIISLVFFTLSLSR